MRLPDTEATDEEFDDDISHDEWSAMSDRLRRELGINDHYWKIHDPLRLEHDDPVAGSLSYVLANIWPDLRRGIARWADCSDEMQKEIVWEWRFSFHQYWSHHVVDALRAINWIAECYGVRIPRTMHHKALHRSFGWRVSCFSIIHRPQSSERRRFLPYANFFPGT